MGYFTGSEQFKILNPLNLVKFVQNNKKKTPKTNFSVIYANVQKLF